MVAQTVDNLAETVERAKKGDRSAFEALLGQTQPLARRIAYSVLPRDHVEDALQESYLLVFRKLPQLKNPEAFTGWLSRLVLHVCYRMKDRQKEEAELPENVPEPRSPDRVVDNLALRQALNRLQPRDRDVLILRELLGLPYEEISFALEIPLGTVRSRLSGARKRLAERLQLR